MNGGGRPKFLKTEVLTSEEFVLGIEPFHPPAEVVFWRLEVEVVNVLAHLAAKAASLVVLRAPDDENLMPERPMGLDPQEAFTKRDETRNVQNSVGIKIVKLNPISKKKASKERMRGGGSESPRRRNARKSTRKPAGGRGTISGRSVRVSAGSFFRMPIFSALDSSFSWTLV
jgi:hypothetical protein